MKRKTGISRPSLPMYERIRQILDSARSSVARSVNTTQVVANWLIGREIVEEEQRGAAESRLWHAALIADLSDQAAEGISAEAIRSTTSNTFGDFYRELPRSVISDALRAEIRSHARCEISDAPRRKSISLGNPARMQRPLDAARQ